MAVLLLLLLVVVVRCHVRLAMVCRGLPDSAQTGQVSGHSYITCTSHTCHIHVTCMSHAHHMLTDWAIEWYRVCEWVSEWVYNPEDTGLNPRTGGKLSKYYSSPPICKTGTWSCTGEQSALAVSHYSLMVLVGLQGAHTCSERHSQYSCELLARAPGVCIAPAHRTCLVHRCPGFTRNAWPAKAARGFAFSEWVCVRERVSVCEWASEWVSEWVSVCVCVLITNIPRVL